jgi:acyl-CoA synthetase (AMP-forming)/AMP-acid ligase II
MSRSALPTLTERFAESAHEHPDAVLLCHRGRHWTYREVEQRAHAIAAWLGDAGVTHGDRVGIVLPNSCEYVAAYFAILHAGACVVALNPDTTAREIGYVLGHCGASAVVLGDANVARLGEVAEQLPRLRAVLVAGDAPVPATLSERRNARLPDVWEQSPPPSAGASVDLDDLAQIIYTSGTTGNPKGVTLSHRNLSANTASIVEYLSLTSADAAFVILPFFYSYGNSLLLTHIAVGGRLVLTSDFVFWNRALDLMQRERATGLAGVPSSFAMLLFRSDFRRRQFPDLRYMTCAGGALPPATVSQLQDVVPHVDLFLMYGQTEASARLSTLLPVDVERKLGSAGRAIPGVQITLRDENGQPVPPGQVGEIVARGENIMVGYWNDPETTGSVLRADGLYTGDLARMDDEGFMFIVGRKSDMIKSGAYRISPQEIEGVLVELNEVAEAAVVGKPDEIFGEIPVAFVVPAPDGTCTPEIVLAHAQRTLPRYKAVREVHIVETLPRTSSGKVRRTELRRKWDPPVSSDPPDAGASPTSGSTPTDRS